MISCRDWQAAVPAQRAILTAWEWNNSIACHFFLLERGASLRRRPPPHNHSPKILPPPPQRRACYAMLGASPHVQFDRPSDCLRSCSMFITNLKIKVRQPGFVVRKKMSRQGNSTVLPILKAVCVVFGSCLIRKYLEKVLACRTDLRLVSNCRAKEHFVSERFRRREVVGVSLEFIIN